ncbi:RNA polymerase sigma factor [Filimonas effusa]|uniref:RNA polymerase sigma factor n=1 Tax=Filimonas effusa TaxID=2508721 RepID=UPI0013E96FB2|nr:RNA polymerase sigma-70 factor [Filimonas effusa]
MQRVSSEYNELELLKLIADGDENAFREFFVRYREKLYSFVFRITKSAHATEELVQDIFLKCWTNRQAFSAVSNPDGYLFFMARNKSIDYLRKLANESAMLEKVWKNIAASRNSTEEHINMQEVRGIIDSALEQLTPQRRTVFHLSRYEGLTHRQIAERLQLSEGTIRNIISEVLQHVRTRLKQHDITLAIAFSIVFNVL